MTNTLFDIEQGAKPDQTASPPKAESQESSPQKTVNTSNPAPLFALPAPSCTNVSPLFALPIPQPTTTTKATSNSDPPPLFSVSVKSSPQQVKSSVATDPESEELKAGVGMSSISSRDMMNGPLISATRTSTRKLVVPHGSVEKTDQEDDGYRTDDGVDPDDLHNQMRRYDKLTGDDNASIESSMSNSISTLAEQLRGRTGLIVILIIILGVGASAAFLAVGISGGETQQREQFQRAAKDVSSSIETQFARYVTAANYVHHYCRDRRFSRQGFRQLYEYLVEDGLDFKAVQFDPNVTREERVVYEEEARQYYAEYYPHIDYQGFKGFDNGVKNGLVPTGERDFYFPIHYMEPVIGNEAAIDLDYYSHISRRQTLTHCFDHGEPAITDRLLLVKDPNTVSRCGSQDAESYGIVLMHPGVNVTDPTDDDGVWPRDVSSIVICIPALLLRATEKHQVASQVYIHDAQDASGEVMFLGGVQTHSGDTELTYLNEVKLEDIDKLHMQYQTLLKITNKEWMITVVAPQEVYKPTITFVVVGGLLVFLASISLAFWMYNNTRRHVKFNAMKAKVETEKATLILENTRQAARAERELNDFIAHEVRNPVAAAMAACSFVKSAVNEEDPLMDPQKRKDTREDVGVICNSLQFINDLLRNMLDMHRASHKQLQVNLETTDLYHDILQSTAGMIYQRDSKIKVIVDCEPGLFVRSDCLRLKQVILNLSRNATKFVHEGFIRLKGYVVNNEVRLRVEDSGIGIPAEKRDLLFAKFQESLDQLSQGTGIGLYLCKNLVELMGGEIYLNKDYDSGIPGCPGTSIEINLKRPPLSIDDVADGSHADEGSAPGVPMGCSSQSSEHDFLNQELPDNLTVLFVDDDAILRKLFARSVKRVSPGWTMVEASNGESALRLLEDGKKFDLIFVDQYMASIDKQLLGTETVLEVRAQGETCRIFGLSANDLEAEFIAAGADGFVIKPFPTETAALRNELLRAYFGKRAYFARSIR